MRLLRLPPRVVVGSARLGWRAGRLAGWRRLGVLGAGVGVGLLVAPVPGRDLRAALRRRVEGLRGASGEELADQVRFELSHHPRTWHLAQPEVAVDGRRVALRGEVPDEAARRELVAAAAALGPVAGVDDQLRVTGTSAPA